MTDLVIRPLVAGEENLFDSMPDPLPQLRQVAYADGIVGGRHPGRGAALVVHRQDRPP
ncbi:hypothetical protein [Micromonospora sp. NPDC005189]|uniref:hypothetical protein n=1 Tax=Micromonospora sp. NPDC005189 TaxID=3157019 RepID=UPI00339F06C8